MKFLHALEIDQGYLAHTPTGTGVPAPLPKKIMRKFKIWLKFEPVSLNDFEAGGSILKKLLQTMCHEAGVITRVQRLEDPPKMGGPKTSKFRRDF